MSMFCDPKNKYKKFPELSGVKARKIRYLVPVAMEICREMQSDDCKHRWLLPQEFGEHVCLHEG